MAAGAQPGTEWVSSTRESQMFLVADAMVTCFPRPPTTLLHWSVLGAQGIVLALRELSGLAFRSP